MKTVNANAYPRKRFFIEMFTRDISLEDCVMDLVDNSIDGLIRNQLVKLDHKTILKNLDKSNIEKKHVIDITINNKEFKIVDNCGGIDYDYAKEEAFNFGHSLNAKNYKDSKLGVYGIGLKRAIFKIGNSISISSATDTNSFQIDLQVDQWVKNDSVIDDWTLPIVKDPKLHFKSGTSILINKLNPDIIERVNDGTFFDTLFESISKTFMFLIPLGISIRINNMEIEPFKLPVSNIEGGENSAVSFSQNSVKVDIKAMFALPGDIDKKWKMDISGWYIICNGRTVVFSDKTELTGWGIKTLLPTYQPKYRSFLGLVMFSSEKPSLLPWTTTKRGLNQDSPLFIYTKNKMALTARPVIQFLNKRYSGKKEEEKDEEFSKKLKKVSLANALSKSTSNFKPPSIPKENNEDILVEFKANKEELDSIKKHLRKPSYSYSDIAQYAIKYLLKQEGI